MNGDQMIPPNKLGERRRHSASSDQTTQLLLTQRNMLRCHHVNKTQNKTQKVKEVNAATSCTCYQLSPGIREDPDIVFVESCATSNRHVKSTRRQD